MRVLPPNISPLPDSVDLPSVAPDLKFVASPPPNVLEGTDSAGLLNNSVTRLLGRRSALAETIHEIDGILTEEQRVLTEGNHQRFAPILHRDRLRPILVDILQDEVALEAIAKRSYLHPLGFSKIVLAEDWHNGQGWDLRIHIWNPQQVAKGTDLTESLHAHRWNFVSRIIFGQLINHRYDYRKLSEADALWYKAVLDKLKSMPPEQRQEAIRTLRQHDLSLLRRNSDVPPVKWSEVMRATGLAAAELQQASQVYSKFQNMMNRVTFVEEYSFADFFESHFLRTTTHRAGELYFHPFEEAHRLSTNAQHFSSTFILVGPSVQEPGMFRREYENIETGIVSRDLFTPESLENILLEYLQRLGG